MHTLYIQYTLYTHVQCIHIHCVYMHTCIYVHLYTVYAVHEPVLIAWLSLMQLDDVMVNLESTRGQIAQLEKKQKKFDAQLAEQQSLSERNAQERDAAEARARQAETKSLSLTHELEELQDKLEESDRIRKQLQVGKRYR